MEKIQMDELELQSRNVINRSMWWSMGTGLVPLPLLDIAVVTGIQLSMLSELAGIYGVPLAKDRVKSILSALLGSIIPVRLAHGKLITALRFVPVIGQIAGVLSEPVFLGASTYAVGRVFTQHFAAGGTFLDFDPVKVKTYFREEFEKGRTAASQMGTARA
jgi:uncharacterized protein (DUF697 family)